MRLGQAEDQYFAVGGWIDIGWACTPMAIAEALELHPLQCGGDRAGEGGDRGVEDRDSDMLSASGLAAMNQRGEDSADEMTASAHVDKRRRGFYRLVGKAGDTNKSRRGLDGIVHRA